MGLYNLSFLGNFTGASDILVYNNQVTGGWFMTMIIVALWIIAIIKFREYGIAETMAVSSYTAFLLSLILLFGKFVSYMIPLSFLLIAVFSTMYLWFTK